MRIDPENRLLWRVNPRRLTFEEARDSLLAVSGGLDRRLGGRAADLFPAGATNVRRTLYGLVDRQFLASVLRLFDFANPDLPSPRGARPRSPSKPCSPSITPSSPDGPKLWWPGAKPRTPPSASACFIEPRTSASRPERRSGGSGLPGGGGRGTATVAFSGKTGMELWLRGGRSRKGPVNRFQPLPHFNGSAWGGGPSWPDPTLGWVQLTARGGHPGNDLQHAAIRRWTASRKARVTIRSTAIHEVAVGDGIRCWIASSRHGVLKSATVHNAGVALDVDPVKVEAGDTIDFVVDIREGLNNDQHLWAPEIREIGAEPVSTWDAARDFAGPPVARLSPWEQLAQVILMTNEMMFVD